MTRLRYTLSPEGSSDEMLVPALDWLLKQRFQGTEIRNQVAVRQELPRAPNGLADRMRLAVEVFPCDLLFVHRDSDASDSEQIEHRRNEIAAAAEELADELTVPHVCLVPVRMSEAWLLISEAAIRQAAENPAGRVPLPMPPVHRIESIADPKTLLEELLTAASENKGRKRRRMHLPTLKRLVPKLIDDFTPLRRLPAFQRLETDVAKFAEGWSPPTDD